jgi:hypothetical protein
MPPPTPVGSCCFIRRSSERPKLVSILAASSATCCGIMPTFICAHRRLRLHCRLNFCSGVSTSVVQLLQQLGPNNYLLRTSVRLILRHHCRLESSPHRTTSGIDGRLESSSDRTTCGVAAVLIIIVATLPLPHFCGIMLLLVAV